MQLPLQTPTTVRSQTRRTSIPQPGLHPSRWEYEGLAKFQWVSRIHPGLHAGLELSMEGIREPKNGSSSERSDNLR